MYLQNIFTGWAGDIHHILKATQEHEIEQRDLYDRPPSVRKAWTDGPVALIGDSVHVSKQEAFYHTQSTKSAADAKAHLELSFCASTGHDA